MNYTVVGAFVLVLGLALIAATLWLASGTVFQPRTTTYLAVVDESVAGLNQNAPVRYNGVDVGRVRSIALDAQNPNRVNLLLALDPSAPVREDTVAVLKAQGLTGIVYIELSGGSPSAPVLVAKPGERYPMIRTKASLSARVENILTSVLAKLDSTSANINAILSKENQESFRSALTDISTVARSLAANKGAIEKTISQASRTMNNAALVSAQAGPLMERIGRAADSLDRMGKEFARTGASATTTVDAVGSDLRRFTSQTLPELDRLVNELGMLSGSLRRVAEQAERDPRSIIFGTSPVPEGPGEGTGAR